MLLRDGTVEFYFDGYTIESSAGLLAPGNILGFSDNCIQSTRPQVRRIANEW